MTNIKLPRIDGRTEAEQIAQIKSYLYQLAQQMNWILSTLGSGGKEESTSGGITDRERAELLNEVKKMISEAASAAETQTAAEETVEINETGGDTNG